MALPIQIVSDVVCPWCFIGKRRFEKALAMRPELDVSVRWLPFQLDPSLPTEGVDRKERLLRKFGSETYAEAMYQRVAQAGREEGIDFRFDRGGPVSNTLRTHRLIKWAGEAGVQDAVVTRLFEVFFTEGRDVGDPEVLVEVAEGASMDPQEVRDRLARGDDEEEVRREAEEIRRAGVTGVPFFLIGAFPVVGAQPPETFVQVLDRATQREAELRAS